MVDKMHFDETSVKWVMDGSKSAPQGAGGNKLYPQPDVDSVTERKVALTSDSPPAYTRTAEGGPANQPSLVELASPDYTQELTNSTHYPADGAKNKFYSPYRTQHILSGAQEHVYAPNYGTALSSTDDSSMIHTGKYDSLHPDRNYTNVREHVAQLEKNFSEKHYSSGHYRSGLVTSAPPSEDVSDDDSVRYRSWPSCGNFSSFSEALGHRHVPVYSWGIPAPGWELTAGHGSSAAAGPAYLQTATFEKAQCSSLPEHSQTSPVAHSSLHTQKPLHHIPSRKISSQAHFLHAQREHCEPIGLPKVGRKSFNSQTFHSSTFQRPVHSASDSLFKSSRSAGILHTTSHSVTPEHLSQGACIYTPSPILPVIHVSEPCGVSPGVSPMMKLNTPPELYRQQDHPSVCHPPETRAVEPAHRQGLAHTNPAHPHSTLSLPELFHAETSTQICESGHTRSAFLVCESTCPPPVSPVSEPLCPGSAYFSHKPWQAKSYVLLPHLFHNLVIPLALKPVLQHIHQGSGTVSKERLQELISETVENMIPQASDAFKLGLKEFLSQELCHNQSEDNEPVSLTPTWSSSSIHRSHSSKNEMPNNLSWLSLLVSYLPNVETVEIFINSILDRLTEALISELHNLTGVHPPESQGLVAEPVDIPARSSTAHNDAQVNLLPSDMRKRSSVAVLKDTGKTPSSNMKPQSHLKEEQTRKDSFSSFETSGHSEFISFQDSHVNELHTSSSPDVDLTVSGALRTSYASILSSKTYSHLQEKSLIYKEEENSEEHTTVSEIDTSLQLHSEVDFSQGQSTLKASKISAQNLIPFLASQRSPQETDAGHNHTEDSKETQKHLSVSGAQEKENLSVLSDPSRESSQCFSASVKTDSSNINAHSFECRDHASSSLYPQLTSHSFHCLPAKSKTSESDSTMMSGKLSSCFEEDETSEDDCCSEPEYNRLSKWTAPSRIISKRAPKCEKLAKCLQENLQKISGKTEAALSVDNSLAGLDSFPQDSEEAISIKSASLTTVLPGQKNLRSIYRPTPILSLKSLSLGRLIDEHSESGSSDLRPQSCKLQQHSYTELNTQAKLSKPVAKRKAPSLPESVCRQLTEKPSKDSSLKEQASSRVLRKSCPSDGFVLKDSLSLVIKPARKTEPASGNPEIPNDDHPGLSYKQKSQFQSQDGCERSCKRDPVAGTSHSTLLEQSKVGVTCHLASWKPAVAHCATAQSSVIPSETKNTSYPKTAKQPGSLQASESLGYQAS